MSDELSIVISMSFSKGGAVAQRAESISVDVTGDAFNHNVQEIGTSEEEIVQGADLGTPGYMFVKNLDSTNYVEIGTETTKYSIKLKAKEIALFRVDGTTIYAKASVALNIEYWLIED